METSADAQVRVALVIQHYSGMSSTPLSLHFPHLPLNFCCVICPAPRLLYLAGYRAILDAMGSFANTSDTEDLPSDFEDLTADIEDLSVKLCPKTRLPCKAPGRVCVGSKADSGTVWFTVKSVADVFTVFAQYPGKLVKLIAADTGRGVFVPFLCVSLCHCVYVCLCMCLC